MSNQVLTMDIIMERENAMILEHCEEVAKAWGPAPEHSANRAAYERHLIEYERALWSGSIPAMFGGGWRR